MIVNTVMAETVPKQFVVKAYSHNVDIKQVLKSDAPVGGSDVCKGKR